MNSLKCEEPLDERSLDHMTSTGLWTKKGVYIVLLGSTARTAGILSKRKYNLIYLFFFLTDAMLSKSLY